MPICEISFAKGLLLDKEQENIAKRMTKLLIESEGLEDNPISRSICLINLHEVDRMYIAGNLTDQGKIIIKVFGFANAYDNLAKEKLCSEITQIFIEENEETRELKGNNIWCLLIPVQPYDFSVAGKPVTLEITRKIVSSY